MKYLIPATSSTAVGASISAANATGKAKYAAAIGPTVTPPPKKHGKRNN
jgi:hypothetical protein